MSSMRKSARGQVDPFIVMDVMEAAAQAEAAGRHIIHMEVGQPSTPAPLGARLALAAALEQPLGYTVALGLPALRQGSRICIAAGTASIWHAPRKPGC